MPKLHYYNPGHETFVLFDSPTYTPTANVRKMIRDLAVLPAWYAEEGDYIYVEENISPRFLPLLPKEIRPKATVLSREDIKCNARSLPKMTAAPWGLSRQSIDVFTQLQKEYGLDIEIPAWKDDYRKLTGRQTACACYQRIKERLPDIAFPPAPRFFSDLNDLESWLDTQTGAHVIKTPYSSSGRGLLWLDTNQLTEKDRNWIKGALKKQGCLSVEQALNKQNDFALEFYSDGEGCMTYKGISSFGTNKKGAYNGNDMFSQPYILNVFEEKIGKETFLKIKEAATAVLQETFAPLYKGYIGVDMLTYRKDDRSIAVHPCIEINMRNTMGMVAIRLFEQYIHEQSSGVFNVVYESNPHQAYKQHQFDKSAYPVEIRDGKLKSGYIPLCPVTKETNYRAFLIIMG